MYDRTTDTKKKKSKQVTVNGKVWNKESLKDLLDKNDLAGERAILRIYSFQTDEEKYTGATKTVNGKGFNKLDVEILSSFAMQLKNGRHLTEKQLYTARPKIKKYAGQLLKFIEEKTM